MPSTAIACGVLLILVGLIGYLYGMTGEKASVTALIPAFVGIVLALLGYFAKAKEDLRKHLMHAALVVALLGFLAALGNAARTGFNFAMTAPVLANVAMGLICLIFVILGVKSFIDARRKA